MADRCVVSLEAMILDGIPAGIEKTARAFDCEDKGLRVAGSLRQRRHMNVKRSSAGRAVKPNVGVIEWLSPLMAGGNVMPELLEIAGCRSSWGQTGAHSPWLSEAQLARDDPDFLPVIPCGYAIEQTLAEIRELEIWPRLRAVASGSVFLCDGNANFNRPGPRIAESLEIIFEVTHRCTTGQRLKRNGWVHLDCG